MKRKILLLMVTVLFAGCLLRVPTFDERQRAEQLVDSGVLFLRQGDLVQAEAAFQVSSELSPSAASIDGLGCVALLRGENKRAEEFFKEALAFDFSYTQALGNLALLYEQMGEPEKAQEYYLEALDLDPGSYRTRNNYAIFLAQQERGQEPAARQQLLKATLLQDSPIIAGNLQRISEERR